MIRTLCLAVCILFTASCCPSEPGEAHSAKRTAAGFAVGGLSENEKELRKQLREASWTVIVRKQSGAFVSKGSCTVFQDSKGQSWALGCHHVIAGAAADDTLSVSITKPMIENGVRVGAFDYRVELTKHSAADDLALMKVFKSGVGKSLLFGDTKPLELDTIVWHCGTYFGAYDQRISKGTIQGHDYQIESGAPWCDMADYMIHPGSSGGGVFGSDGELLGITSWMHKEDSAFFVPMRTIAKWLKSAGMEDLMGAKEATREVLPMPKARKKK